MPSSGCSQARLPADRLPAGAVGAHRSPGPATAAGAAPGSSPGPHPGVLLGMPAQHLDSVGRRPAGRARDRLPHHGRLRRSRPGSPGGDDPDGRRGMPSGPGWLPFAGGQHYVQNIGDGTFFHSGSLAVRAAVAAGVDITYKLLYNDAVAMTGGQQPEGRVAVPELTRLLALEGVRRVIVTTPEPKRYRGVALDPIAEVRHRDQLQDAARRAAPGRRGHGAHPRRPLRGGGSPPTPPRPAPRAGQPGLDQPAGVRGVRGLRGEVELPVGRPDRDRVRPQDDDPPGVVQRRPVVPPRGLPVVRAGDPGPGDRGAVPVRRRRWPSRQWPSHRSTWTPRSTAERPTTCWSACRASVGRAW